MLQRRLMSMTQGGGDVIDSNGHQYVDLGLSVLWATCNVGAPKPEEYGGYYNWGGSTSMSNTDYYDGEEDLPITRDTARNLMGGSWRMPTIDEFRELMNNCNRSWTKQYNVQGNLFTSKINSRTIFLPAAGCYIDSIIESAGSIGYYWSRSWNYDFGGIYCLYSTNSVYIDNFNYGGLSVRGVIEKPKEIYTKVPETPGCYIAFHRKSDGKNCACDKELWPDLEFSGEEADGVLLVVEGRDPIVIAPTEASSSTVYWSSSSYVLCNTALKGVSQVKADFNGRNYIANIDKNVRGNYAGPLCYKYSRPGIPAKKWWLPSGGELQVICDNKVAISLCLEVISGSSQFSVWNYWSSTEFSDEYAWPLYFSTGNWGTYSYKGNDYRVRAVAAFE